MRVGIVVRDVRADCQGRADGFDTFTIAFGDLPPAAIALSTSLGDSRS
ncbi:MAG: hypothetical protein AAFX40_03365 [Cyanobacteria bacterium J06639_1]